MGKTRDLFKKISMIKKKGVLQTMHSFPLRDSICPALLDGCAPSARAEKRVADFPGCSVHS